jgi:two-component sensor histidine kinase
MLLAEKQLRGKIELDSVRGTKYHIQFKRVKEKVRI